MVDHKICTGDAIPIKQAARRPPRTLAGKEEEIILDQLQAGVIRKSSSPWASPMVYVLKKDGTIRPCVDYRKLNVTLKDEYPLPRIDDCLDNFGNAKFLSTPDLQSGYWQIRVAEEDCFCYKNTIPCPLVCVMLRVRFNGVWKLCLEVCNGRYF